MAETQGFEPWEDFHPRRFSRPMLSTTQPNLHQWLGRQDSNLQPAVPKTDALPIELLPNKIGSPLAYTSLEFVCTTPTHNTCGIA